MPDGRNPFERLAHTRDITPTGHLGRDDDVVMAMDGASARVRLQSADIVLTDVPSRVAGIRWIARTFRTYPGCVVAGARHDEGLWCVLSARDTATVLVSSGQMRLYWPPLHVLAKAVYLSAVAGERTSILVDVRDASPIPIDLALLDVHGHRLPHGTDGRS